MGACSIRRSLRSHLANSDRVTVPRRKANKSRRPSLVYSSGRWQRNTLHKQRDRGLMSTVSNTNQTD